MIQQFYTLFRADYGKSSPSPVSPIPPHPLGQSSVCFSDSSLLWFVVYVSCVTQKFKANISNALTETVLFLKGSVWT